MWYVICCIVVWIIAVLRSVSSNLPSHTLANRSSFETKPTTEQANVYAQELVNNQNLITGGLEQAKQKMHWIDSITYEDARELIANNAMTHKNAMDILNF